MPKGEKRDKSPKAKRAPAKKAGAQRKSNTVTEVLGHQGVGGLACKTGPLRVVVGEETYLKVFPGTVLNFDANRKFTISTRSRPLVLETRSQGGGNMDTLTYSTEGADTVYINGVLDKN